MEYRQLGRSGLRVSKLCLGTMTFGEADSTSFMHNVGCDETTAGRIMDEALDAGVNFFDTADVYGNDGLTEQVIGRWFAARKRRDDVVLATKFRFRMHKGVNGNGAARIRIVRAVEDSLRRLQTDRIDLYQVHMQDIDTPEDETLRALDDLVRQGKVLYLGASNYAAYRLMESLWVAERERLERFVAFQAQYSLVVRDIEREHVPLCQKYGLGILPWSPLAGGFLSGKMTRDQPPPAGSRLGVWKERRAAFDNDRNWKIVDELRAVAGAIEATPSQVALAWALQRPGVTSVIFGARSPEQLHDNLKSATVVLSAESVARLDAASAFPLGYPYEFMRNMQGRW